MYYIEELDTTTVATPKMWPAAVPRFYFKAAQYCTIAREKFGVGIIFDATEPTTAMLGNPTNTGLPLVTKSPPRPPSLSGCRRRRPRPALYGPAPEPNRFRERILRRFDRKFSLVAEFATGERRIVVIRRRVALQIPGKILLFSIFFRDSLDSSLDSSHLSHFILSLESLLFCQFQLNDIFKLVILF